MCAPWSIRENARIVFLHQTGFAVIRFRSGGFELGRVTSAASYCAFYSADQPGCSECGKWENVESSKMIRIKKYTLPPSKCCRANTQHRADLWTSGPSAHHLNLMLDAHLDRSLNLLFSQRVHSVQRPGSCFDVYTNSVSWSESEPGGSSKQGCTTTAFTVVTVVMNDWQSGVIWHALAVMKNSLNYKICSYSSRDTQLWYVLCIFFSISSQVARGFNKEKLCLIVLLIYWPTENTFKISSRQICKISSSKEEKRFQTLGNGNLAGLVQKYDTFNNSDRQGQDVEKNDNSRVYIQTCQCSVKSPCATFRWFSSDATEREDSGPDGRRQTSSPAGQAGRCSNRLTRRAPSSARQKDDRIVKSHTMCRAG